MCNNLPAGAANDTKAPFNDISTGHDLSHLCPSCDDLSEELCNLVPEEDFESDEDYNEAVEDMEATAELCKSCHKLEVSEWD